MSKQEQIKPQKTEEKEEATEAAAGLTPERQAEIDKAKAETDELLDEIDTILEQNAEEFVKGYIQKGGE